MGGGRLESAISSMRDTVGVGFSKPDPAKMVKFEADLKESQKAQDYLQITRNLTPETIANFKLGYDVEKDAIAIPVFKRGELINIRYRYLDEEKKPKYTQEKGAEVWLYNEEGIVKGQKKGGVVVTEGEFDCMSVWQSGGENVVSVASGKNSYGVWIELLDNIPKVFIAFDNDKPGKQSSLEMAERVGTEKSYEILYPEGIKDANDFFKEFGYEEFKNLVRHARPFYKYQFAGVSDVIASMREKKDGLLTLKSVPFLQPESDWLIIASGMSNVGKTTYAMNVAKELLEMNVPTLVLPFERGTKTVGKRFLQVYANKTQEEFDAFADPEWDKLITDAVELPLYFAMPKIEEIRETLTRAKRLFNIKFVVVDHLNYLVRKSNNNENTETSRTLQEFKALGQELDIIFFVIHHIRKSNTFGTTTKKPGMEDLKGSSSTYQDPEAVIMLNSPAKGQVEIDIVKNKGAMGSKVYEFNTATGVIDFDKEIEVIDEEEQQKNAKAWFDSLPANPA